MCRSGTHVRSAPRLPVSYVRPSHYSACVYNWYAEHPILATHQKWSRSGGKWRRKSQSVMLSDVTILAVECRNPSNTRVTVAPTPGYQSFRGFLSRKVPCSRTGICQIHHCSRDTASVSVTFRRLHRTKIEGALFRTLTRVVGTAPLSICSVGAKPRSPFSTLQFYQFQCASR